VANPRIFKNFNLFVDGRGQAGKIDELELPTLTIQTEEHRAGGMDAPIELDLGMEAMEASFTLAEYDENVLRLFGLADGNAAQLTARGALQRDGEAVVPVVVNLRGMLKEVELGTWQAGEKAAPAFSIALRYYRYESAGVVIHEIDVENMIRKVNGVDQLAQIRAAIGI
jgi:P2 family phage contractile tail tube protein